MWYTNRVMGVEFQENPPNGTRNTADGALCFSSKSPSILNDRNEKKVVCTIYLQSAGCRFSGNSLNEVEIQKRKYSVLHVKFPSLLKLSKQLFIVLGYMPEYYIRSFRKISLMKAEMQKRR